MATPISAMAPCAARMSHGEYRLAERRETVLNINDRNTGQRLQTASRMSTDRLRTAHQQSHAWGNLAVMCRDWATTDICANALQHRKLPHPARKRSGDDHPSRDTVTVTVTMLTRHVCKGLELPVVALPGIGHMPAAGEDEQARLFYVAATRATHRLVIGAGGDGEVGRRLNSVESIPRS